MRRAQSRVISMTTTAKSFVLVGVLISVLLAALMVGLVWGAVSQGPSRSYEGYFAPVYSPDGQYVYFIERSNSATIVLTRSADLLFSPAQFDVHVAQDTFILKRLPVENGKSEELTQFPPSPIQGRRYQQSGNPSITLRRG
jgi:hypothetical protein